MAYSDFEKLCYEKRLKASEISRETGVSKSTLSAWKQGLYTPKLPTIEKLAEYLGCQVELLTRKENETISEDVQTVISVDTNKIMAALETISGIADKHEEGKKLYYLDPETAELAQALAENPNLRLLMDAARGARPEAIKANAELLMTLKKSEMNEVE